MNEMRSFWSGLPTRAKVLFVAGVIVILAVAGLGAWWALRPTYAPLAQNLRPGDASEIATALSGWGIPYRFDTGDKIVSVPVSQVYAVRMKLASAGIPKGGSIGFEAFKDSGYGVTEFAQQVNYQRALQGELERTIESMQEVQSARVQLTIHHSSLFEKDQDPSKGSVTLHLRPGAHIGARQVAGIQRLVASAAVGLKPGAVTVLDQDGTVLSGTDSVGDGGIPMDEQSDRAAKLEDALRARVSDMLEGALHRKDFTVSVAVQMNYDKVKRVQERLLTQGKDGQGVLVHEKTDTSHPSGSAGASGSAGGAANAVASRDVEYAHGKVQEEIEEAPGRIQRISVGIVVAEKLSPAYVKQLSDVVAAGIGLDSTRGDRIDIAAIASGIPSAQHAVATVSAIPVVAEPPTAAPMRPSVRKSAWPWGLPAWGYVAAAVALLLVGILVGSRARRREPRRLTAAERDATLEQLENWINQPERVS